MITFKCITHAQMARMANHRYEVWDAGQFIGEVFAFRPDADRPHARWLAQSRDGCVHGWLTHIRTRKAAGQVLAAYAKRYGEELGPA